MRESCGGKEHGPLREGSGDSFALACWQGGFGLRPCPTLRRVSTHHLSRHGDAERIGSASVCRKGTRRWFPPPGGLFPAACHVFKGRSGVFTAERGTLARGSHRSTESRRL